MSNELMMETIQCLNKTFTAVDKSQRQEAEARLKQLEGDLLTHFKILLEALKNDSILSKELKISLILYLRKIVKDKIQEKLMSKEYAIEILKYYVDIILSNTLTDICLQNLTQSLQDLLNFKIVSENKQIVNELVDLLHNYVTNIIGDITSYRCILLLQENIILSSSVSHLNGPEVLKKMLLSAEMMLTYISALFRNPEFKNDTKMFLSAVDTCKLLFNFLYTTVIKMRSRLNIIASVSHLYKDVIIEMACYLITMTVPDSLDIHYISFNRNSELDNAFNQMKSKVLQFINAIIGTHGSKIENPILINAYSNVVKVLVESLDEIVVKRFSYLQEMSKESIDFPDYNYSNILYQLMLFIGKIIVKSPFLENFVEFSKNFAKSIIFPLLISTKSELLQMKENGEEYCNYIADVIDDHKMKTIKSVSAFLIQNMSEKFDGLGTFIVNYCVQLVDFIIKGSDLNTISNYNLLTADDRIFKLANSEYIIETSFLIFTIQTSYVFRNKNLKDNIKNLIAIHFQQLLTVNSDLIKSRVCLFLGFYMDSIYEPDDIHFSYFVEFLFQNLFYYRENKGVAHQSADSLNDIIGVKKFTISMETLIGQFLPKLVENIKEMKIGLYFDVLLEIVININIDNHVIPLLKELSERVITEIAPYTRIKFKVTNEDGTSKSSRREKNTQYNIIVNKCFNIIRTLAEKSEYVNKYILQMEEILEPIFEYMKTPAKIDFDEDIILILTSFIKNLKYIPKSALKVLIHLPKYLRKSNGLLLDLYELVNQLLIYGKGVIDINEEFSKIIMKIFRASFDKNCDYDKSTFLGASLMQVWVQNSSEIPLNFVKEIMLIAVDQIKSISSSYKDLEDFEDSSDVFNFIALTTLLYSGFIYYPLPTFEAIITNNNANDFMQWSETCACLRFFSSYLAKSLIIGICAFLRNEILLKQVPDYINKMLKLLLILLNKQKKVESKSLKDALKKEIQCNFIESDEEEDHSEEEEGESNWMNIKKILSKDMEKIYKKFDIDEMNGYSNEREIQDICDRTVNPLKSLDEYEIFKQSIEFLNNLDNSFWETWTSSLSDSDRLNLDNLLHTRRINISLNKINANVPRKLVKIVNKHSNVDHI